MKRRPARHSFEKDEKEFWSEVKEILHTVFGLDASVADEYKRDLAKSSRAEREYILHDDPRNVALELSNVDLSDNERVDYFRMPNLDRTFMQRRAEA